MKISSLKKYIKNPYRIFALLASKGKLKSMPDSIFLSLVYRGHTGKKLNLKDPKTFSEKIQWLKINNRHNNHTNIADKYKVRDFVAQRIGENYLIPILGVYDSFDEIKLDQMPNQFVLKCTHDSGGIIICDDKNELNINQARRTLNRYLNKNFFYNGREWPYKNIKPRIICEYLISDNENNKSLTDYKIYCFHGEPLYTQVIQDDNNSKELKTIDFFDREWNHMEFNGLQEAAFADEKIPRPRRYGEMMDLAAKLSKNFIFIRVDFYYVNGDIYFGELTFFPRSGFGEFSPREWNERIGNLLKLPTKQ